jgi:hypothetical protein
MEQKPPRLGEMWSQFRPRKTVVAWSCVASVVLTVIVGFGWGGWVTGGKARFAAEGMASDAVAKRLGPICVVRFNADPGKAEKLKELNAASVYEKGDYVKKQGWATMPGEEAPDSKVADECVKLLGQVS